MLRVLLNEISNSMIHASPSDQVKATQVARALPCIRATRRLIDALLAEALAPAVDREMEA
jgi:hypothetical protein